jgi:vitamin B12 transporter
MTKRFIVLAAVLTSIQLSAQTDSSSKLLDEAFVTANKFEQKQSQTGKVVAVISKEQLERSNGKSLAQVLNEQAGVVINGALNAPGTVQTIYMRGASSGRVIILLDGIPINDPSMINNEFDLNFISVHDIERIEIARGAQSTAYGSDAITGAINIITVKKDLTKPFNATLTAIAGNLGTYKVHTGISGRINRFTYHARFNFIHTNGFSSAHDSTGIQDFDKDGQEGDMFQARIQYDITGALKTYAWFSRSRYDADIDANAFIDERDYFLSHTNSVAGIGVQYKKGKLDLRSNYQYGITRRQFRNDSGYISTSGIIFEKNHFEAASHFYELYGNYKIKTWLSVLAGMDYRDGRMKQDYYALSLFGPFSSSFGDTSLNQLSGYASVFLSFLKNKLNLEAGARFNDHSRYGSNSTYTFNPSYNFTAHFRIFGSIASGFKAPSIYQLYDGFSGNPGLSPEKSTNYEAGASWNKEKLGARVVYFHRDIDNGLDFNYNTFKYFNFVEQTISGLEFELRASPVK